jgi:ABC-type branched-subunit amino acid transport system substrate-binding protein
VACEWLSKSESIWRAWMPENLSSKTRIYLGGMFPITGPYFRSPGILPGAVLAKNLINADPNILPDYELELLVQDTQCVVDIAMQQFLEFVIDKTQQVSGIIGPACSETVESVAGVSKYFKMVVISYSTEVHRVRNHDQFPLFLSTVPHFLQYRDIYVEVFKRFHWGQVALLAEDVANFPEYHNNLKDYFLSNSISVLYERKIPAKLLFDDVEKYIDDLKRRDTKIIILTSYEQFAIKVLCMASRKGMTARNGYIWFLPSWFTRFWWNRKDAENVPCTAEEMQAVLHSHMLFAVSSLGPMDSEIVGNMTVMGWLAEYNKMMNDLKVCNRISSISNRT